MTTSALRRQVKNIVHNYSEAEIKVREATSNDPWGPSSSLMSEIADLTFSVVAFSEVMSMVWKRLNDHGKNWRHVYKVVCARRKEASETEAMFVYADSHIIITHGALVCVHER
uniref:ENTH domain-containing protein n=1 Tax=Denticeps clupeoides TaxID=299321 RepID=A0AAY3ZW22_9TELE